MHDRMGNGEAAQYFVYRSSEPATSPVGVRIVDVSPHIAQKNELMEQLSVALDFPGYFGRNWDALDECLRDLSWLEEHEIELRHKNLPLDEMQEQRIYLSILQDCLIDWVKGNDKNFVVSFPESCRELVEKRLLEARRP